MDNLSIAVASLHVNVDPSVSRMQDQNSLVKTESSETSSSKKPLDNQSDSSAEFKKSFPGSQDETFISKIQKFQGLYNFNRVENSDEYLKALGVGLVLRKVQAVNCPKLSIVYSPDTNKWSITFMSIFNQKTMEFTLGEAFEDETYDCRKCSTVMTFEDEKFIGIQRCEEGALVRMEMELEDKSLRIKMQCDGHVAYQHFDRAQG